MAKTLINRHKFNAVRTTVGEAKFDSKKEAARYNRNLMSISTGEMLMQLRQVPFHLPGGIVYRIDFVEFYSNGDILWVDVKGRDTRVSINKRKTVEALYPIKITLV